MRRRAAAIGVTVALAGAACGGNGGNDARHTVTVLAASSLTDVFGAAEKPFADAHANYRLTLSFAGSQQLAAQVQQGAPADVIATADRESVARVEPKTLHRTPVLFARNRLVIVVRRGNPSAVRSLADLARPDLRVVLAAPSVPAGSYARQSLAKAKVTVHPVSLEENVAAVVTKVGLGEADAGIAYATDARQSARGVDAIAVPDQLNVNAEYFAMVLPRATQRTGGEDFIAFLLSTAGRQLLERYGFSAP